MAEKEGKGRSGRPRGLPRELRSSGSREGEGATIGQSLPGARAEGEREG